MIQQCDTSVPVSVAYVHIASAPAQIDTHCLTYKLDNPQENNPHKHPADALRTKQKLSTPHLDSAAPARPSSMFILLMFVFLML